MPTGSSATPGATTSIRAPASKPVSKTLPQVYTENGSEMPVSDPCSSVAICGSFLSGLCDEFQE